MCCVCYLLWQRNVEYLTVLLFFVITPSWAYPRGRLGHGPYFAANHFANFEKGHTTVEWARWRHQRNANRVFGYLSVSLAPFGTVFGYFWLKTSGNPGTAQPSHTQSSSQFSTCCCAIWKWSVFFTSLFFNAWWPPWKERQQ